METKEFIAFDYNNPIHQRIGVLLTVMYWAQGDFKGIYDEVLDEDELYWQVWKEFGLGPLPKSYPNPSKKTDKVMEQWLNKEHLRFESISFLRLSYTNYLQTPNGEPYFDIKGRDGRIWGKS